MLRYFARRATQYIFFELIPPLIIGLLLFIFILLMFQALRLTDFVLAHGVGLGVIGEIIVYLSVSFVPVLLPMSLLFAVIMTYGRLSADSEVVAMKASGMSMISITLPAFLLSCIVGLVSGQTSFHVAPWGNRQFELTVVKVGQARAGISLKEGTFAESFFNLVVYANTVDSKRGTMEKVFIYDDTRGTIPLTVIAKRGQIINDAASLGHSVLLRLYDGDIHRKAENHTKIKFDTYDIQLLDPTQEEHKEKTPLSMSIEEVDKKIQKSQPGSDDYRTYLTEFHKRWALAFVCPIFGLLGVSVATQTNRRNSKGGGLALSLGIVVIYWVFYVAMESMARAGQLPVTPAIWAPNVLFSLYTFWRLKKNWN